MMRVRALPVQPNSRSNFDKSRVPKTPVTRATCARKVL
jgi:hypothetical protein